MDYVQQLLSPGTRRGFLDPHDPALYTAALCILFNPIYWNIVARAEYRTHFLTRLLGGSPHLGCYALAASIFGLGLVRDHFFNVALDAQPLYAPLHVPWLGAALFGYGQLLVLTSMWALGVTGTYLGDYFGILMDHKVEGFPFNVPGTFGAPMYVGSSFCFLGTSLWKGRVAGVGLTALVVVMYVVACQFEDPFTEMIYAKKEEMESKRQTRSMAKSSSSSSSTPKQTPKSKKKA